MQLSYARATVSDHDATVNRTWEPCLYLKNDMAHGLSISKKYSVSDPTIGAMLMQTHAIMNQGPISNHLRGGLHSRTNWMCSTSLHTTHTYECESPGRSHTPGPSGQANLQRRPEVSGTPQCHAPHEHPHPCAFAPMRIRAHHKVRVRTHHLQGKQPYAYEHTTCMRSL